MEISISLQWIQLQGTSSWNLEAAYVWTFHTLQFGILKMLKECIVLFASSDTLRMNMTGAGNMQQPLLQLQNPAPLGCNGSLRRKNVRWRWWNNGGRFQEWYVVQAQWIALEHEFLRNVRREVLLPYWHVISIHCWILILRQISLRKH